MKRLLPLLALVALLLGAPLAQAQNIVNWVDSTNGNSPRAAGDKHPLPVQGVSGGTAITTDLTKIGGTAIKATPAALGQQAVTLYDSAGNELVLASVTQVNTEGQKASYSAAFTAVTAVASATDVATLCGSASKTGKVTRIAVSGIATAVGTQVVNLIKRSTADTGGTSAALAIAPMDSTAVAVSMVATSYTANPTAGTAVATIRSAYVPFGAAAAVGGGEQEWEFGTANAQALTLRGIAECVAINLNAAPITGAVVSGSFEWTEE